MEYRRRHQDLLIGQLLNHMHSWLPISRTTPMCDPASFRSRPELVWQCQPLAHQDLTNVGTVGLCRLCLGPLTQPSKPLGAPVLTRALVDARLASGEQIDVCS